MVPKVALTVLSLSLVAPARAARLEVASVRASSTYPVQEDVSYGAELLVDGRASTSWVEGEEGSGLGSWVELDLGGEHTVTRVELWHGLWYSFDYFQRANKPRKVALVFSDGSRHEAELTDAMEAQTITLDAPVRTSTVRLRVESVYSGSTWLDTGISEIQVFDDQPGERLLPAGHAASSRAAADADGSYEAHKVSDGLRDTMWCEGRAQSDGSGEYLELRFASAQEVGALHLINGIGTSMPFWIKGNRATAATLRFSDGSTEQVKLRNTFMEQEVRFTPRTTTSVRITFDGIVKGKEFDDLCVSEAYFSE